jgi:hypothetical protein
MAKLFLSDRQHEMRGMSADIANLLRQKAAAPIKPAKPQKPCDVGLFSDDADQIDLVSWLTEQTEE